MNKNIFIRALCVVLIWAYVQAFRFFENYKLREDFDSYCHCHKHMEHSLSKVRRKRIRATDEGLVSEGPIMQ